MRTCFVCPCFTKLLLVVCACCCLRCFSTKLTLKPYRTLVSVDQKKTIEAFDRTDYMGNTDKSCITWCSCFGTSVFLRFSFSNAFTSSWSFSALDLFAFLLRRFFVLVHCLSSFFLFGGVGKKIPPIFVSLP